MLFKLSNLKYSNVELTLGYLNPALNNSALTCTLKRKDATIFMSFLMFFLNLQRYCRHHLVFKYKSLNSTKYKEENQQDC